MYKNDCFYFDGGIFVLCPLNDCIIDKNCDESAILCFKNDKITIVDTSYNSYKTNADTNTDVSGVQTNSNSDLPTNNSNLVELIIYIIKILFHKISKIETVRVIENTINVSIGEQLVDIGYWKYAITNESERSHLIEVGIAQAKNYLSKSL
jgi:hypothetical protein